jgi:hypothetical protein
MPHEFSPFEKGMTWMFFASMGNRHQIRTAVCQ